MARATRSTAQQEKESKEAGPSTSPPRSKNGLKKRKRQSIAEHNDQPAAKQMRSDSEMKEDDDVKPQINEEDEESPQFLELLPASDMPLNSGDALKILSILEMIDTQGLLDRVFPIASKSDVTSDSATSSSSERATSCSLRTLLGAPAEHTLLVLRNAVKHLFPISSHPRSRPSPTVTQQLRFCELTLSLLDQASFNSVSIPLDIETLLYSRPDDNKDLQTTSTSLTPRDKQYALVQHLPSGDWWSSLNSTAPTSTADSRELKGLSTGHAELVAVIPSSITDTATEPVFKLGSYGYRKTPWPKKQAPPRYISCGSFLDYGPFASFAPNFDQDGKEGGRDLVGEVHWRSEQRKRAKALAKIYASRSRSMEPTGDVEMHEVEVMETKDFEFKKDAVGPEVLEGLLSSDQVESLNLALAGLEMKEAVHELLSRNAEALKRLDELQRQRIGSAGGGSSDVEVGSEEWDTAQSIMDSLITLTTLRPKSSSILTPLIPPVSVLRKLHRSLPFAETQGWRGTLPAARTEALRDDSTLRIKPGTTMPVVKPVVAAATTAAAPASPYAGYPYTAAYRTGAQTPYKPSYYTSAAYNAQPQTTAGTQAAAAYYGSQPQYGATGHQQYQYGGGASPWFNYQNYTANLAVGSNSGRGTPQPVAPNYVAYATSQQAQTPGRAVANTVTANKAYTTPIANSAWPGATAVAPTLPAHLCTGSGTVQASTPIATYQITTTTTPQR